MAILKQFKVKLTDNPTFYFTLRDLEEFLGIAGKTIERIRHSNSARQMVLEAWLLVDLRIRDLLLMAFRLNLYNTMEYDLRYELLPNSFCHPDGTGYEPPVVTREYVDSDWLTLIGRIPASWYKHAEKLNRARNVASHSYDERRVLSALGLRGANATEQARRKCIELIQELIGIEPLRRYDAKGKKGPIRRMH